ncbi:MAG: hypothetical protein KAW42_02630 [Candidatus Atribacteria bacterium]|nr:hypothetical protein [Candidatus Atribacteria bacterium]
MVKINDGATLWARQTIDSDIFCNKPDKWFKIWFYLVNKANHKDNKQFIRGSCFMKYEWIMEQNKATKNEVDHCIRWLKSAMMIATRKATQGFIVEVLDYNTFQRSKSYKSETKATTTAKQKRNKSNTINKCDKYDNKDTLSKERQASSINKQKKQTEPLEFSFTDKCWYGLADWRIKMYQGRYPMLSINYYLQDLFKSKFLSAPKEYKELIKTKYNGKVEDLVWAWLGQAKKFYLKDHPDYQQEQGEIINNHEGKHEKLGRNMAHIGDVLGKMKLKGDK